MSIVLTTPTGQIGSRATQLLIQAGIRPTLLVRDASRLSADVRERTNVLEGNLTDKDFVLRATSDAEALFWLIPSNYRSSDPLGEIARLGEVAAAAVQANGIGHTVLLSSQGADERGGDLIGALGNVEDLLNATGANVLHLRPGYFFSNLFGSLGALAGGILPTTLPLDIAVPWNDPRDIGDIVAARLLARNWSGHSIQEISGPRDLTTTEVASIIGDAVGKSVTAVQASEADTIAALVGAGFSEAAARSLVIMNQRIARVFKSGSPRSYVSTTPTTLEAWVYANLKPALTTS